MRKVKLTRGFESLVDDGDYEELSKYHWYVITPQGSRTQYAEGWINSRGLKMHRFIMGLKVGDGKTTDHINGNGLDNRRANLRIVTKLENDRNRRPYKVRIH